MRVRLRRAAVSLYVLWLVAVVLHVAGRFTPFPTLPGVFEGVVAGAVVFTALGAVQIGRRGVRTLRERAG
ncbi:hypothetical protein [Halostella salina]|uniref:hypothetical protein n=1 Tax=Halostella salina TaxID=1547897 RepID=UPI000EF78BC9|nr:hypothetical protein [Halostella salina]